VFRGVDQNEVSVTSTRKLLQASVLGLSRCG
jgi:hypothetical protein